MKAQHKLTFQFISEPTDVNFGGKVHGGAVMKWIDQAAYTCARTWAESYCVTVYVGGIRFYRPINIGELVKIKARVIYTGNSSIHIAVDVYGRKFSDQSFEKKTHCVIVFVSVDKDAKPQQVRKWKPRTEREFHLESHAKKLNELRKDLGKQLHSFYEEMGDDEEDDD